MVADSITQLNDLLQVALANKHFHATITPVDLRYRVVQRRLVDGRMRTHLSERPACLDALRFLHLENPHRNTLPVVDFTTPRLKQALPVALLKTMTKLHAFEWNGQGVPGEMSVNEGEEYRRRVWTTVVSLPSLKEVTVLGWFPCSTPNGGDQATVSPVGRFRHFHAIHF